MLRFTIFMTVLVANAFAGTDDLQCYPNRTIHFTNPNNTVYTHYKAFYDIGNGTIADCIGSADLTVANVYFDCASTTTTVTAYFSDRNLTGDNILGGNAIGYTFFCNNISDHNTSVAANLTVDIVTDDESDDPLFEITAAFYDGAGIEQTSATVGDTIFYVIKGPAEYDLKPISCTAYGDGAGQITTVISEGCTEDSSLMSDFTEQLHSLEKHYNSTFYVFKFYDSDSLTVNCTVQVCVDGGCDFSCGVRRKRRATDVADLSVSDMKTSSVGGRLRILDAPLGAAASIYGTKSLTDNKVTDCHLHNTIYFPCYYMACNMRRGTFGHLRSFGVTVLFSLFKVFVKIQKFVQLMI